MAANYTDYGYRSAHEAVTAAYLLPHLKRLIGNVHGPVLDLGCGNGAMALHLIEQGFDVYGVDASKSGVAIANGRAPGRFHVVDLASGRLPASLSFIPFQTVISTEVIEHLYDPRALIAVARDIVAPRNGSIILSTPYHGYLKSVALAVSGKYDAHFTVSWHGGHIKFFSLATLTRMLDEQGLRVTEFVGAGRLPWLWKSMIVKARCA